MKHISYRVSLGRVRVGLENGGAFLGAVFLAVALLHLDGAVARDPDVGRGRVEVERLGDDDRRTIGDLGVDRVSDLFRVGSGDLVDDRTGGGGDGDGRVDGVIGREVEVRAGGGDRGRRGREGESWLLYDLAEVLNEVRAVFVFRGSRPLGVADGEREDLKQKIIRAYLVDRSILSNSELRTIKLG